MIAPEAPKPSQAPPKRAVAFVDGQNLFHCATEAFGYRDYPNYNPLALADRLCGDNGWRCDQARLYTGVPKPQDSPYWHNFWAAKKRFLGRDKRNFVFTRDTHYRSNRISFADNAKRMSLPDGTLLDAGTQLLLPSGRAVVGEFWVRTQEEKGIDVRIALDMIRLTYRNEFDVGIVFSQDQDLSEAITEIREIANDQKRFVEMFCAFPHSSSATNDKPIRGTTAILIDRALYDSCLDRSHYSRR